MIEARARAAVSPPSGRLRVARFPTTALPGPVPRTAFGPSTPARQGPAAPYRERPAGPW